MKSINKIVLVAAMAAGVYTSPSQAQIALVNRWSFNGNLLDSSGNGNNGALSGSGSSYVTGLFGQQAIYSMSQVFDSGEWLVGVPHGGNYL
jgi:hypothetical protein